MKALTGTILAALVLLSACSSDGADGDGELAFDAVLVDYFGTTDTDAYLAETEQRASELIVECMAEAGFEFQLPPQATPTAEPEPGDLEAAQQIGFGIIADYRSDLAESTAAEPADPNLAYLTTLTATEIDRFFLTLEGPEAAPGQLPEGGCRTQASDEAYADWNRFRATLPNAFVLDEERDSQPEWLDARAQWRDCMAERGFEYADPEAIRFAVVSQMQSTVEELYPGGRLPLVRDGDGFALDPELDDLFDELVQFERDAAVANIECNEAVADQMRAVDQRVQQDYVERNREAIDDLLAD